MTTKVILYNRALRMLGQRALSSISAIHEHRFLLDTEYDNEAVKYCLEQGFWPHARRVSKIEYTSDVEPTFGLRRAFTKPSDFVRLIEMSGDEHFSAPLTDYSDDPNYWFANIETIYVGYVSDDSAYGLDLTIWPPTFVWMVAAFLAKQIGPTMPEVDQRMVAKAENMYESLASDALSKAAMNGPIQFQPVGSWRRSRRSSRSAERGSQTNLTG
jgi:hypothetical protein